MPIPTNARLQGLVSLVELFQDGKVPGVIADDIRLTYDALDLLTAGKRERYLSTAVAAGGAVGQWAFTAQANFNIPANEQWLVYGYNILATIAAGATAQMVAAAQIPNTGGPNKSMVWMSSESNVRAVSASNIYAGGYKDRPIVLPPGTVFGGITLALDPVATAINAFGLIDFVRMKI